MNIQLRRHVAEPETWQKKEICCWAPPAPPAPARPTTPFQLLGYIWVRDLADHDRRHRLFDFRIIGIFSFVSFLLLFPGETPLFQVFFTLQRNMFSLHVLQLGIVLAIYTVLVEASYTWNSIGICSPAINNCTQTGNVTSTQPSHRVPSSFQVGRLNLSRTCSKRPSTSMSTTLRIIPTSLTPLLVWCATQLGSSHIGATA